MKPDSSRLKKSVFVAAALLLALTAGSARHSFPSHPTPDPSRPSVVHGRRLTAGLPPVFGEDEEEGSNRERLLRWIESRHRAAPGYDWRAIEAANLRASLAFIAKQDAEKARAAKPVWHERGPVNQTGATALVAFRPDGKTLLVGTSQAGVFSGVPGTRSWKRLDRHPRRLSPRPAGEREAGGLGRGVSGLLDGRVYVSRNRGTAWSPAGGLPPLAYIYEMIQDGGNHRVIYLLGLAWQEDGSALPVLARSRDGGLSFSVVWSGEVSERPGIWTSRVAAGPLYLLSRGQLFVSSDQGSSFSPLGRLSGAQGYASSAARRREPRPSTRRRAGRRWKTFMYRRMAASPGSPASRSPAAPTTRWRPLRRRPGGLHPRSQPGPLRQRGRVSIDRRRPDVPADQRVVRLLRPSGRPAARGHQRHPVRSRSRPGEAVPQHRRRHLPVDRRRPQRAEPHGDRPAERAVLQHLEQRLQPGPLPRRLAGPGAAAFASRDRPGRRDPEQRATDQRRLRRSDRGLPQQLREHLRRLSRRAPRRRGCSSSSGRTAIPGD